MKRVLAIAKEGGVSEFFRVATPYRLLAEAGLIELDQDDGHNPALLDRLKQYDAVVFSRPDSPEHTLLLAEAQRLGLRVIVDIDDNLLLLPPSLGIYSAWHVRGNGQIMPRLWYFKHCIKRAAALTVSTSALGRQLCDGQPHRLRAEGDYLVLPNQVLAAEWETAEEPGAIKEAGTQWVGWWGIYHHWDDWRDIAPYIEPVIFERSHVRLVVLGMPEVAHLFPRLKESGQLMVAPFVGPEQLGGYRAMVKQFDVALAPTSPSPFNESKSDLKVLQYGAAGVPVIASPVTYGDWRGCVQVADYGLMWGWLLANLLDNPEQARWDGAELRRQVLSERTYEGNFERWMEAVEEQGSGGAGEKKAPLI